MKPDVDYHEVTKIPAIEHNGTYSSYNYTPEGLLGERVKKEEAEYFLVHHFHIEKA